MPTNPNDAALPQTKDLAEGFSTQAKIANKMWVSLIVVVALVILPDISLNDDGQKDLPFGFGKVNSEIFQIITFFIMSIISIAFCSARAQALIAYDFAHQMIDKIQNKDAQKTQRRYFDILTNPTLVRVGPLGVLLKTTYFKSKILLKISSVYYFMIKHLVTIVFCGIPIYAIFYGWHEIFSKQDIHMAFKIISTVAGIINITLLAQNWLADTTQTRRIHSNFSK